jgi:salicylate hydroxylase
MDSWESVDGINLTQLTIQNFRNSVSQYGEPFRTVHRIDLHAELLRLAREGPNPVLLNLSTSVQDVDPQNGIIKLSDGVTHQPDIIIGADGIHSTVRRAVVGSVMTMAVTDMSAFRFLVPTSKFHNNPELENLLRLKSSGVTIFADTRDKAHERHIVWYACQGYAVLCLLVSYGRGS